MRVPVTVIGASSQQSVVRLDHLGHLSLDLGLRYSHVLALATSDTDSIAEQLVMVEDKVRDWSDFCVHEKSLGREPIETSASPSQVQPQHT